MSEAVLESLEKQVACYRRLAKLAELQHIHVQQDQTESLLDVLKSRQDVLDEIALYEQIIGPAKRNWPEVAARIATDLKIRAESLLSESRRLLEQITLSDRQDALVLQQRKLSVGKQITQAASASRVNKTYATAAYGARQSRMNVQT